MLRVMRDELLDADAGSPREIASALRSLGWVNRLFGGYGMHARLLRAVWPPAGGSLHVLEVASGHADALQAALAGLMRRHPARVRVSLLDQSPRHLPDGAHWRPGLPPPERLVADALNIPLRDNSVDVVSCCLFVHHLAEDAALRFAEEGLRVARRALLINDLERSATHYLLARLWSLVDPSRLSRHDGPVSVRRAYTAKELSALLAQTGHRFQIVRGYLFRLGAIVWKE